MLLKQLWIVGTWTQDLCGCPVVFGTMMFHHILWVLWVVAWVLPGSGLFWLFPWMLDCIGIWGVWRPSQRLGLCVVLLELFLSSFYSLAAHIVLPGEAAAIREHQ